MQHGIDWEGQDLSGWHVREKFDGIRAYWDGSELWTRGGKIIAIPADMRAALPSHALDCELYDGTDGRSRCAVAARTGKFTASMALVVFDAPDMPGDQVQRLTACGIGYTGRVRRAEIVTVKSTADVLAAMRSIHDRGGEGVMCSAPGVTYKRARVRELVKVKTAEL